MIDPGGGHYSPIHKPQSNTQLLDSSEVTITHQEFGSTTYRYCTLYQNYSPVIDLVTVSFISSFVDLISDSDSEWENDPAIQPTPRGRGVR